MTQLHWITTQPGKEIKEKDIIPLRPPDKPPTADDAVKHGLQLGPASDIPKPLFSLKWVVIGMIASVILLGVGVLAGSMYVTVDAVKQALEQLNNTLITDTIYLNK